MSFDLDSFDLTPFDIGAKAHHPPSPVPGMQGAVPHWFSTAIAQEEGSNIHKLMRVFTARSDEIRSMHRDLADARCLSKACGDALDALAALCGIVREPDETDDLFRRRIPITIAIAASSGTVADIAAAVSYLTGVSPDNVVVVERYLKYPFASITVRLTGTPDTVLPWQTVDTLIDRIKAAGVLYESPGYDITPEWVAGLPGWGNTAQWGIDWY